MAGKEKREMLVKSYPCPAVVTGSSAGRRCKCAVAVWTPVHTYRTFQEQLALRAGESVQLEQSESRSFSPFLPHALPLEYCIFTASVAG